MKKDFSQNRKKVLAAFAALRKQNIIARANFMCCSGCAQAAFGEILACKTEIERKTIAGIVFWHRQDDQLAREQGILFIRYVGENVQTEEIGIKLIEQLNLEGVSATWNGDTSKAIEVRL